MSSTETLEDFYRNKFNGLPENLKQDISHFNVFRLEDTVGPGCTPPRYARRDFYKISLIRGKNRYHYADKSIDIEGTTLMFFNPNIPYTFELLEGERTGYFCIFREAFFTEKLRGPLSELPMFAHNSKPSYLLNEQQDKQVSQIFDKMLEEINSSYAYKYDLLRSYTTELVHHALKLQPSETLFQHPDANTRITAIFTELLERQFPIESPMQRFTLRSAKDFAEKLNIHVNHLNRAIKTTTGRTTTEHISERLLGEAKALLKHTQWNISEISYCLGFEEPAHFNHFFKKQTSTNPSAFRVV